MTATTSTRAFWGTILRIRELREPIRIAKSHTCSWDTSAEFWASSDTVLGKEER